jgi:O-antigen ligase
VVDLRAPALGIVLAALLVDDGGYFALAWGWSGAVAAAAAALGIAWLRRVPTGRLELLFVGGLGAFGLWALVSASWSQSPPSSVAEAQRAVVPVAAALAVLVLFRRRDSAALVAAVLGAITVVSIANLLHRATSEPSEALGAAAEPVGYDNALGLLAALGVLLALELATRRGPWMIALATLPLNAGVLLLSESTGAALALGIGLAAAGLAAGGRLRLAGAAALAAAVLVGLLSAGGHQREDYWPVALGAARDHPVGGAGAGTFWQLWLEEREEPFSARDAHGLYVETLGELGVVGLLLLLAALAAPLAAGRRRPLLLGAYVTFLVHAGLDWDWEHAGVATVGVLLGCALLLEARERQAEPRYPAAWAAGAAGLFLAACVTLVGAIVLDGAREALREGRPADAARAAERAASVQPWASEPWLVLAEARRAAGGDAGEAAREGLERDGNDWRLWAALAQSSEGAERERALARARSLNPLGPFDP